MPPLSLSTHGEGRRCTPIFDGSVLFLFANGMVWERKEGPSNIRVQFPIEEIGISWSTSPRRSRHVSVERCVDQVQAKSAASNDTGSFLHVDI